MYTTFCHRTQRRCPSCSLSSRQLFLCTSLMYETQIVQSLVLSNLQIIFGHEPHVCNAIIAILFSPFPNFIVTAWMNYWFTEPETGGSEVWVGPLVLQCYHFVRPTISFNKNRLTELVAIPCSCVWLQFSSPFISTKFKILRLHNRPKHIINFLNCK